MNTMYNTWDWWEAPTDSMQPVAVRSVGQVRRNYQQASLAHTHVHQPNPTEWKR